MMRFPENGSKLRRAALAVALVAACSPLAMTSAEETIEVRELRTALEKTRAELAEVRERNAELEKQRKELTRSLAEAVRVSEEQVAAARETKLKLQAFGVDLFTQDEDSLEQRLLKAVRDLDICRQDIERQSSALHSLSEAFLKYLEATPDAPESERSAATVAIEEARGAIAAGSAGDEEEAAGRADLSSSQVVSIDSEIGLVVLDSGRRDGVRVGTPVAVLREGRPIYSAMIVDVRDAISGAVLQDELSSEAGDVAVGDGVRLLPNRTNF